MGGRELLGNPSRFRWRDSTHCVGEPLIRVPTISAWVCDCSLTNVIRNRYEKRLGHRAWLYCHGSLASIQEAAEGSV